MTKLPRVLVYGMAFLFAAAALAQEGILSVHVTYLGKKPLSWVRIGPPGEGSIEPTDAVGRAQIRLAAGVKAGQEIKLQVVTGAAKKESWVFISPWDQRVIVPPFDGRLSIALVLARRSDKEALLGSSEGRQAILQSILSNLSEKRAKAKAEISESERRAVLHVQAAIYGLRPKDIDTAIRSAAQKTPDLYEQGLAALYEKNYPFASDRLSRALKQAKERVADCAFFLGQSLYEQGRYHESVIAYEEAATIRGEDPFVLNHLGLSLWADGNYAEAESSLNHALEAARITKPNLIGTIQGNLGLVLQSSGDLKRARHLGEEALEALRRSVGSNHPDTLEAMSNLAETLRLEGNLTQARQLQEQVLTSSRKFLGPNHVTTLESMNNLAITLFAQGDLEGARQLAEQALLKCRRILGPDHPNTLIAMNNMAAFFLTPGDLPRARQLLEQVVDSESRSLGSSHPNTLAAMGDLAAVLHQQKDLSGARRLQEQVLEELRRLLGPEHLDTLRAMGNLAHTLGDQGDLAGERQLEEKVLEAKRRQLGPKHPETNLAEWNLLMTRKQLGDEAGWRELQSNLAWLLEEDEAKLSSQDRMIREALEQVEKGAKN